MLAKEIMHKHVFSVTPGMTLREVSTLFEKHGISGAPVVGPEGAPVGLISTTDILAQPAKRPAAAPRNNDAVRVEQVMTPWCVTLEEDASVRDLARQMLSKRIHRVVITRDGAICGIVSTLDVLSALLKELKA